MPPKTDANSENNEIFYFFDFTNTRVEVETVFTKLGLDEPEITDDRGENGCIVKIPEGDALSKLGDMLDVNNYWSEKDNDAYQPRKTDDIA